MKLKFSKTQERRNAGQASPHSPHCLIFIEDYDIYQYFDGNKSFFLDNNPYKESNIKVAVISKNIHVSDVFKNTDALANNKPLKKSRALKYINKYYKNESYFLFECNNNGYGVYHTLPANTKKYYSLGIVNFVIPYEYLVILFLNNKLTSITERQVSKEFSGSGDRICGEIGAAGEQTSLLFIEETDKIYKAVVVASGFNLFPVISFKEDMLNENLSFLQTELNSKRIKINKIVTNSDSAKAILNDFYAGVETVNFNIKEFFEFFNNLESSEMNKGGVRRYGASPSISRDRRFRKKLRISTLSTYAASAHGQAASGALQLNYIPHFENSEIKFKKLAHKKNRLKNLLIVSLLIFLIIIINVVTFINGNVLRKKGEIVYLNNKIAILNNKIVLQKAKSSIDKILSVPDIVKYLKKLILIFPKGTKIKNLIIIKSKSHYIFYGKGFVRGGYKKFIKNYNKIFRNSSLFKMFHITYDIDKFDKPNFRFHGVIR